MIKKIEEGRWIQYTENQGVIPCYTYEYSQNRGLSTNWVLVCVFFLG